MPQLDVLTYPSQIFWLIVGFIFVYVLISKIVTPKIEETFEHRNAHIEDLFKRAKNLKAEAKNIEMAVRSELETEQLECIEKENKLISNCKEYAEKERNNLSIFFAKSIKQEMKSLKKESIIVLEQMENDIDSLVNVALKKLNYENNNDTINNTRKRKR